MSNWKKNLLTPGTALLTELFRSCKSNPRIYPQWAVVWRLRSVLDGYLSKLLKQQPQHRYYVKSHYARLYIYVIPLNPHTHKTIRIDTLILPSLQMKKRSQRKLASGCKAGK